MFDTACTAEELIKAVDAMGTGRGAPEVIAAYQGWIAAHPQDTLTLPTIWFNLGIELAEAGRQDAAIQAYQSALAVKANFHPACFNLGLLLERMGHKEAALQTWKDGLQSDEARTMLLNQRARLLEQMGQLAEAHDILRTSLMTNPDQSDAVLHWVHLRQKLCLWPVLAEIIPGLSIRELAEQSGALAALAYTDDISIMRIIGGNWVARKTTATPERLAPPEGYRHEKLRIGYLSSDFCNHAMSYLIVELFERHDRQRFETYGYCNSKDDGTPIRRRVMDAFDHFTSIKGMADEDAARLIRADEIDMLIDLNGLTSGERMQVLRWKPAPVQATYLGFIGPVPVPELDYMLCDSFVVPPEYAAEYHPTPMPIEGVYQANDSKRVVGPPMTRAEAGLPDGRFVFCCFSSHYKITEAMFSHWMEILRQAEDAVLWLIDDDPWSRQNLSVRALAAGVNPARLIFAPRVDPVSYLSRLALADAFLDTFPYNAGTVASDAIRMHVPLVTLSGRNFASRMAGGLLHAIGADAGITTSAQQYVALAVTLATDASAYAAFRALFAGDAWARSLGDAAGFARRFEAALQRMAQTVRLPEPV